ncbi:hypothetical protein BDV25DRAFT_142386 [Aspergillus avenaceus]|uniref:ER-bound oxygenase mpaB/mpaB'/Rubber oxygenase catalytic domain-containing protein n=1 Tax=Aspergillus avenaceus TaxID=36643 RepID=A0A5N6TNY1_ASPAV|nr:hypothetical protein BDV25DRAFT_142386 [Aspergillus avenaceus]
MSLDEKKSPDEISQTVSDASEPNHLETLDKLEILPQMLQEGILFAGAGSALLLQAAFPGIRNRTHDHNEGSSSSDSSNLAKDLGDALQANLSYIACLVFGTSDEKKTLLDLSNQGKPPLKGSENFSSHRPTQLWVAATLYATATDFYQRIYGRVNYRTAEKAYAEFTVMMHAMGLPPGTWPENRQLFWQYWDDQIEQLTVTADAHRFAQDLLQRTDYPGWVSVTKPVLRAMTIEMLPPRIREAYGLKSTFGTRSLYRTTMGFSVAVYPALPGSTRGYPLRYYLEELRKNMNVV